MTRRVARGAFRRHCRTCGWSGTYSTAGRADHAKRRHSCEKALRDAARKARGDELRAEWDAIDRTPKPCLHKEATHRHGTYACWTLDGCRCQDCKTAQATYDADRNRRQGYGTWDNLVDAEPVREHVRSLMDAGMGLKRIVATGRASQGQLWKLLYGLTRPDGTRRPPAKRVRRETAERLLAVELDLADGALVDGAETARRLQALVALGWSASRLGARLGIDPTNMSPLVHGRRNVTVARAKAVHALYRDLVDVAPPQDTHRDRIAYSRSRTWAREQGWAPPLRIAGRAHLGTPLLQSSLSQRNARDGRYVAATPHRRTA